MGQSGKISQLRLTAVVCSVAITLALGLLAANLGVRATFLRRGSETATQRGMVVLAASVASLLRVEEAEAIRFVTMSAEVQATMTTREMQASLNAAALATDTAIEAVQRFARQHLGHTDNLDHNPFFVLRPAALGGFRAALLRRNLLTDEIRDFYESLIVNTLRLTAHSVARGVKPSSGATAAARYNAVFASLTASLAAELISVVHGSATAAELNAALRRVVEAAEVWDHTSYRVLEAQSVGLQEEALRRAFDAGVRPRVEAVTSWSRGTLTAGEGRTAIDIVVGPSAAATMINGSFPTPRARMEALAELVEATLRRAKGEIEAAPPAYGDGVDVAWPLIATALVCGTGVVAIVAQRYIRALMSAKQDEAEEQMLHSLEQSFERMKRFVDCISRVQLDGAQEMEAVADKESQSMHAVEREVYKLHGPTKTLLSFAHPALTCMSAFDVGSAVTGTPELANAESGVVPLGLQPQLVSLLFIDMSAFHGRPSSESVKALPNQLQTVVRAVDKAVVASGGVVHEISGTTMICAWNAVSPCFDAEAQACHSALTLAGAHDALSFAVTSGEAHVGFVGTATHRSFTILGAVTQSGRLLLRLNRLHGTAVVVDHATFSKLDAQVFKAKPLEVIAVDQRTPPTVAFEVLLWTRTHERDGRFVSWNEAFEEYKAGDPKRARHMFSTWVTAYGTGKSAQRLLSLLCESPPRTVTHKFSEEQPLEDELF